MKWIPEAYPRSGGLAAAGFSKLLGRPSLDPLAVLVRETAQNSWDARLDDRRPVGFAIMGLELSSQQRRVLRETVFTEAHRASVPGLVKTLAGPDLIGLYISDRNTKGLGGPLQADQADPNGVYNWVNFVLNVGKENKQGHSGGTYGFGKTIAYVVSSANAVVIHSRTRHRGREQTRLIACAIGTEFTHRKRLYTGRHWWGERDRDVPRPLTGRDADRLAAHIGMPAFADDRTGTNILVLAPAFDNRTSEQAMRFIAEAITWHLWPKMIPRDGQPAMRMSASWNGRDIPIATPEERPPLDGFAHALRAIWAGKTDASPPGMATTEIRCERPVTIVGDLATLGFVRSERAAVDDGSDSEEPEAPAPAAAVDGACHHVALLRTPELVVSYLEGPPPIEGGTEWAGVFRVRDANDDHFAKAEPPTHDAWRPSLMMKGPGKTIVNVGLREINAALNGRWARSPGPPASVGGSTAVVAEALGHLIRSVEGRGPGRPPQDTPAAPPSAARPRIEMLSSGPREDRSGGVDTFASFRVTPARAATGTRLYVKVAAALDGTTPDADLDSTLSLVEARIGSSVRALSGPSATIDLEHEATVDVEVLVARGPETTVLFDLQAQRLA